MVIVFIYIVYIGITVDFLFLLRFLSTFQYFINFENYLAITSLL